MHRQEYPRPQFVRDNWINLNGTWAFEFDDSNVGVSQRWFDETTSKHFSKKIEVPFAYQTDLSGINDQSFHDWVWYRRTFEIPQSMAGKRVLLHFGAVDYRAWVYINGVFVGSHEGGHTPFSFDITAQLRGGTESIVVRVEDPSTDETIPRGKQFWEKDSAAIWYTRTTGIWQTVWLEAVSDTHIKNIKFTPNVDSGDVVIDVDISGDAVSKEIDVEISMKGERVAKSTATAQSDHTRISMNVFGRKIFRTEFHNPGWTWTPESPNLFDVSVTLRDGLQTLDHVDSYFGMRKVETKDGMVFLNNRPYYQKLILDQGYWPEGLLTAPSDEAFKTDIILAKEAGFNGARKHQKVEDPRYLYWADKLGFIVWGECAASASYTNEAVARLTKEWIEIVDRDYNHPCIITWVPLNESWGVPNICRSEQQQHHSSAMYHLIHSLDPTRLVVGNDGWEMTTTDICALHNYNHGQADELDKYNYFKETISTKENLLNSFAAGRDVYVGGHVHQGEPIMLTEFGGIGFKVQGEGWGYTAVTNVDDYLSDYRRVMEAVFASRGLAGYCYTQLCDVEQEINGILTYDRKPKVDLKEIYKLNNLYRVDGVKG